ncbi:MAG: DUF1559 domain-containing protein [Planctomycetaceae bacterium]|nr:DUF1559 domain-containing protein [Planctomycetaceae bacterium]
MKRTGLCLAVLITAGVSLLALAAPSATVQNVAPESLLPQTAVIALHFDGDAAHRPAIEQTAAWKALEQTGMRARVFDLIETFIATQRSDVASVVRSALEGVMENGLSLAASASADGNSFAPYGMMVVHNGAEHLPALVNFVVESDPRIRSSIQERTVDGRSIQFVAPGPPGVEVAWWIEGQHAVLAGGMQPVEQIMACAKGDVANVVQNPLWSELRRSDGFTVNLLGWIDTERLLNQFGDLPFPEPPKSGPISIREFVDLFGLVELQNATIQGGYHETEMWNRVQVRRSGPAKGLLKLLEQRPVQLDEIPPLPPNTDNVFVSSFDIRDAVDIGLEILNRAVALGAGGGPDEFAKDFEEFQQTIGGHPREVFSAGLGDLFCVYNDPTSLPIPIGIGPVMVASVEERETVRGSIVRLLDLAKKLPDAQKLQVRETEKDGSTYFSLIISGSPIVPTILLNDDWVVASLMPGAAQNFAARLNESLPRWEAGADVQAAIRELPSEFSSISISDPAPGYRSMMMWAPMAVGMLETQILPKISRRDSQPQLPFGIQDLPSPEQLTEPMFPNVTITRNRDNGIEILSRQSVPSTPLGNVGAAAIVPVLVALLLPAVQAAREAARRTQSKNHLKQIGLAMHNYHDVYRHFPQGTVANPDLKPEQRLNWAVELLPFLEQQALYSAINRNSAWDGPQNKVVADTAVPVFQNPSQRRPADNPGSMDYVGIAGIGPNAAELPIEDQRAGIFGFDRSTRIRDITDGTSNTLMVSDAVSPNRSFMQGGSMSIRGFSQQPYVNGPDGIGSPHAGGFQAVLADGSVRFISAEVDPKVLEALATMHGGERVGDF